MSLIQRFPRGARNVTISISQSPSQAFSRISQTRQSSGQATSTPNDDLGMSKTRSDSSQEPQAPKKKTQAELDKELELKMQGLAGDGGNSGIEYEDGQPVSMKRSVRNNMFRYI